MKKHILLVEDESLVAMLLEDCLVELGYEVAASASNVPAALAALAREAIDLAVLDVNLGGTMSFPIADALAERGISFIFVTGYGQAGIPERFRDRATVQKPFHIRELHAALLQSQVPRLLEQQGPSPRHP